LILAILFVFPAFLIEAALGQWRRQGMIESWNIMPILKGNNLKLRVRRGMLSKNTLK